MTRPEDALIPLVAAAVLMQMLAGTPLRFEALFATADLPKPPLVQTVVEPPRSTPPRPVFVRDEQDHFGGAS
ncbi:hypothetical protein [Azospirillum sp. sgz301742]